ncbi:PKD domain-containing protein [Microbacterium sp. NPDC089698]|uniref:PKD domain-containing protein n=1 Tax=Microbacterium sp. NPDC089698 TaxID=3364200 RepID=UPI003811C14D
MGAVDAVRIPGGRSWSVTITDLARFVPSAATVGGEPGNVAVVGLPANFLSGARTETIPGTILGRALSIRFTPVNYAFDYGDGERRDSAGPGTAWDANRQAQFTPTSTSHVYKEAGRYTVTVTVTYAADVDLGSGWIPIRGTLDGPPAGQEIRVVKAHTALVLGTCQERPSAPGC